MASRAVLLTGAGCLLLSASLSAVQAADCTTGQGCRAATSCLTGGTVYCCAAGGRLVANGTAHTCTCEAGSGLHCSGGASVGVGAQFLPAKPAADCTTGQGCRAATSCLTGGTVYCCAAGGRLVANGTAHTCTCEAGSGLHCSGGASVGIGAQFLPAKPADDGSSSSNLASGLTCVMAPILVVCFQFFSQLRG